MLENEIQVYWVGYNHTRWENWDRNTQSFVAILLDTPGRSVRDMSKEAETGVLILSEPTKQLLTWTEKSQSIA